MFNWFRIVLGITEPPLDDAFIDKVEVPRRWHRVDAFVVVGWALILIKCVLASWAIQRWDVPIDDFYVWGPSLMFGALCTFLYLRREDQ